MIMMMMMMVEMIIMIRYLRSLIIFSLARFCASDSRSFLLSASLSSWSWLRWQWSSWSWWWSWHSILPVQLLISSPRVCKTCSKPRHLLWADIILKLQQFYFYEISNVTNCKSLSNDTKFYLLSQTSPSGERLSQLLRCHVYGWWQMMMMTIID